MRLPCLVKSLIAFVAYVAAPQADISSMTCSIWRPTGTIHVSDSGPLRRAICDFRMLSSLIPGLVLLGWRCGLVRLAPLCRHVTWRISF